MSERLSLMERITGRRQKAKLEGVATVAAVDIPTYRALERLRNFFQGTFNRYQLYRELETLDSDFQSGLSVASIVVKKSFVGYTVKAGETLEQKEKDLLDELRKFEKVAFKHVYDIAYKMFRDGDACYVIDKQKQVGVRDLIWLPPERLTILENKADATRFAMPAQEANWYCLNEIPKNLFGEFDIKTQWFKSADVLHANWNRQEKVQDINNRFTYGIWTLPPTDPLSIKLVWKLTLIINDMLLRDVMVPREHHKLPSASFAPELFAGANQEERISNAMTAADNVLNMYAKGLEGRRVDRGYVTLDTVEIDIKEPSAQYTAPNDLIDQITESINKSIGTPETALSGRGMPRGSFASEIAVGTYLVMKGEFVAESIAEEMINLAKMHLDILHPGTYTDLYDQIDVKLQLIFFKSEQARQLAIMGSIPIFTTDELRDMVGLGPLNDEQKKDIVQVNTGFVQSAEQIKASSKDREDEVQPPRSDQSKDDQQKT